MLPIRHGKYVEPRKSSLHDLQKLPNSLRKQLSSDDAWNKKTNQSIIKDDWNTICETDDQRLDFYGQNELINIMDDCDGLCNFAIYAEGSTRIDFLLISCSLKTLSILVDTHHLQILFTLIIMVSSFLPIQNTIQQISRIIALHSVSETLINEQNSCSLLYPKFTLCFESWNF